MLAAFVATRGNPAALLGAPLERQTVLIAAGSAAGRGQSGLPPVFAPALAGAGKIAMRYCAPFLGAYNPAEIALGSCATVNSVSSSPYCRPADERFVLCAPMS